MAIPIEIRTEGSRVFVIPDGELDVSSSPELREELSRLVAAGHKLIVMDMTKVSYMDSSGLGALVAIHKTLAPQGSLALVACRPAVERVLRFTQFDRLLEVYRTFEDLDSGNRDNLRAVSGVSKSVLAKQKAAPHTTIQRSTDHNDKPDRHGRRLG